jgi:hypothetical protein
MASSPQSRQSLKHIQRNGYVADIYVSQSKLIGADIYHYIVQRENSAEILHWGQEVSLQRALECVDEFIDKRISKKSFPASWGT